MKDAEKVELAMRQALKDREDPRADVLGDFVNNLNFILTGGEKDTSLLYDLEQLRSKQ